MLTQGGLVVIVVVYALR